MKPRLCSCLDFVRSVGALSGAGGAEQGVVLRGVPCPWRGGHGAAGGPWPHPRHRSPACARSQGRETPARNSTRVLPGLSVFGTKEFPIPKAPTALTCSGGSAHPRAPQHTWCPPLPCQQHPSCAVTPPYRLPCACPPCLEATAEGHWDVSYPTRQSPRHGRHASARLLEGRGSRVSPAA